jgi:sugar O-acyltransferase (sialic acid O-acetyltransferase NeuD family)
MQATPLLVFPFNGNAVEALDCIEPRYRLLAFIDDLPEKHGKQFFGHPVRTREALRAWPEAHVLAVPGGPASFRLRRSVIAGLDVAQNRFATVIHPSARVSPLATIGRNTLIMAGVVVTSNAVIGDHVCILPNTVIHHDVEIGSWTLLGANVTIAGSVVVEDNCYVASGTSIMNGLRVGAGALIGIGSNVIRAVAAGSVVAGNPARPLCKTPMGHGNPR